MYVVLASINSFNFNGRSKNQMISSEEKFVTNQKTIFSSDEGVDRYYQTLDDEFGIDNGNDDYNEDDDHDEDDYDEDDHDEDD